MFVKGLINSQEYETLKARVLKLNTDEVEEQELIKKQQNRKQNFNFRIIPIAMFDVANSIDMSAYTRQQNITAPNYYYGGLHIEAGPAIKKRFHPTIGFGFEASTHRVMIPLYADFNMNILKSKISPFFHVGGGFIALVLPTTRSTTADIGSNALLGFGVNINTSKFFSISFCPDYRFIYLRSATATTITDMNGQEIGTFYKRYFTHQIGLRISLIFY